MSRDARPSLARGYSEAWRCGEEGDGEEGREGASD
jgi:hypothetical protein